MTSAEGADGRVIDEADQALPSPSDDSGMAAFPSTPKRPLAYVEIAGILRRMILEGPLTVGQKLPSEQELARHFGSSRATVREALSVLASEHLILTTRGATGGRWVAEPKVATTSDTLEIGILRLTDGSQVTVDELLEMREIVETPTAMLAALRRDDSHLQALRESVVRITDSSDSSSQYEANQSFHRLLAAASGNRLAVVLGEPIFRVVRTKFARDPADTGFWDHVVDDHGAILAAVESGDWRSAGTRMSQHLQNLRSAYTVMDRTSTAGQDNTGRQKPAAPGISPWLGLFDLDGSRG